MYTNFYRRSNREQLQLERLFMSLSSDYDKLLRVIAAKWNRVTSSIKHWEVQEQLLLLQELLFKFWTEEEKSNAIIESMMSLPKYTQFVGAPLNYSTYCYWHR
jgi:hypothetical protein